jgi:hypothetical protein
MKELAQNLGSAFGRLINETMIPTVSKILQVMDDRGLIDLPLRVNGLEVKVAPVSPLAMAQNMEEVNNVLQFAQIAQGAGPEGQMTLKVGPMLDLIAEKLGVPAAVRNSPEERALMAKDMAQQAQALAAQNPEAAAGAVAQMVGG